MASEYSDTDVELHELLENDDIDNDPLKKQHDKVLEESKAVANAFSISSTIGFFSESMMLITWILFAKSMPDCTDNAITTLVFLQAILQIVGILFTSYLSDKYGFDLITIYTSTLLLISALLHSVSYSIFVLGIGVALKGLVMDDIEVTALGFFGKLLPYNEATIMTGNWYAFTTLACLLGFFTGGVLSTYTSLSNRLVFIIASVIILFRWIYIIIKIRNTEKILTDKQLVFCDYYLKQKENQASNTLKQSNINDVELTELEKTWFPLCLQSIRDGDQNKTGADTNNSNGRIGFELIMNIAEFSFISSFLNVTWQFIAPYMSDRFDLSVFFTQFQLVLGGISFGVVSAILPDYLKNTNLITKYTITFPLFIIVICVFMFAVPLTDQNHQWLFWIWWLLIGSTFGGLWIISEIIVLELQPKRHTGKVNGVKTASRYIVVASLSALIAYFWNSGQEHSLFAYFQGISYIIAAIINILLIFYAKYCKSNII